MARLLLLIVLLILYGSWYPWRFDVDTRSVGQALRFLASGSGRVYWGDALVNVVFYVPVGACSYLTFCRRLPSVLAAVLAVTFGTALSGLVEVGQFFAISRSTSIYDIFANALGSLAGVMAAVVFAGVSAFLRARSALRRSDPYALTLLVCWLAYLMFPLLPVLAQSAIGARAARSNLQGGLQFATAAVTWFVLGEAIQAAGMRRARLLCALSTLLIPLQMAVLLHGPTSADFGGALVGAVAFGLARKYPAGAWAGALGMILLLIARGLLPFQLTRNVRSFGWVPFATFLGNEWYWASDVLLAKIFVYSAAIWALHNAGYGITRASGAVAALLALIELAQLWLPHTADITDPLLALMIGVSFRAFADHSGSSLTVAPPTT